MSIRSFFLIKLLLLCLTQQQIVAQSYTESYFQQRTDYNIIATLDTQSQLLEIDGELSYANNSPDDLEYIYFHVWWNAFSDKTSAFAEQQLANGMRQFYFAKDSALGGYNELVFSSNGIALKVEPYFENGQLHKDIIKVVLDKPLMAGTQRFIQYKSLAKIPDKFSRPGRQEELYRMTQWYPKPAVYDREGWQVMPYLDIGEFYSEYGDYQVELVVPESYKVAATGVIMEDKIKDGHRHYKITAEQVPDFAWFASETFVSNTIELEIDNKIIALTLFTNDTENTTRVMTHIKTSIQFYSEKVGLYPYPQYTLVLNASEDRGGMEYPMISIVDMNYVNQVTDNLIAHEIGHNWFQSAIGSNERAFPWMDEGMNSFYERKYNAQMYEKPNYEWLMPRVMRSKDAEYSVLQSGVCHLHCCGKLRGISNTTTADGSTDVLTYGTNSYERMAFSLRYLEGYLTEEVFSKAVAKYYNDWKHKHPSPEDLQYCFESVSQKDLSWFFQDIIEDNKKFDLSISALELDAEELGVTIHNKGAANIPYHLSGYGVGDVLLFEQWYAPSEFPHQVTIPNGAYQRLTINGSLPFLDMDRKDNHFRLGKMLMKRGYLGLGLMKVSSASHQRIISAHPNLGFNEYDGLMLGIGMGNTFFPYKDIRWYLQPNYSLSSGDVTGLFAIEKDFGIAKKGKVEKWTLGLNGRRYNYNAILSTLDTEKQLLSYYKLSPELTLHFNKGLKRASTLQYKLHYISAEQYGVVGQADLSNRNTQVHQLNYKSRRYSGLSEINNLVQLEYESYQNVFEEQHDYLKLSVEHRRQVYYRPDARLEFRFFGGYFLQNSNRNSANYADPITRGSFALTQQAYTDHTYEGFYFGRSEQDGRFSRQITEEEGGFKMPTGSAYRFAMSNDYLMSMNFKMELPFKLIKFFRFKPFMDIAYLSNKTQLAAPLAGQFLYSGGLALEAGALGGIYLPLFYSSDFDVPYADRTGLARLSVKIDLRQLNLWKIASDPGMLVW